MFSHFLNLLYQIIERSIGELSGVGTDIGFKAAHHGVIGRRPTAIGIAPQDFRQRGRAAGQRFTVGERPAVQPLGHDLDPTSHAQVLDAEFTQGDIEVAKHGIEESLRQPLTVRLTTQPVDGERCVQGQRIEPAVERVGNAAGTEQFGQARMLSGPRIESSSKFVFGTLAAKHDPAPCGHGPKLTRNDHHDMLCTVFPRNPSSTQDLPMRRIASFALAGALLAPLLVALPGCDPNFNQRGFAPTPGSVEKLEVGTQSREDVIRLVGSPSAVSTFNPNIWYYISETQESFAFLKTVVSEQKVIQVTFNDSGRIAGIKNYDLKDAENIAMVQRITPTSDRKSVV